MPMQVAHAAGDRKSYIRPYGYQTDNSCGYCKNGNGASNDGLYWSLTPAWSCPTAASYYAEAVRLTVEHYQALLDRGWRRLDTTSFKAAKDQRQALHRWNTYVLGTEYIEEARIRYPTTREEKRRRKCQFDLRETVHAGEYPALRRPPEPDHQFTVTLEADGYTEEKFALFQHYQSNVHHEPSRKITKDGFRRFLCSSPLRRSTRQVDGVSQQLGSYHQCYRLDGRLVAIGVLDLLPQCVSAIYFIYHQDVTPWAFGKLGALREAAFAIEGRYRYYYMGYYIHSCPKMRYKRDYKTQQVLDAETYDWDPLDAEYLKKLDDSKFLCLSRERRSERASRTLSADRPLGADDYDEEGKEEAGGKGYRTVFDIGMPGAMPPEEVTRQVDLSSVLVGIPDRGNASEFNMFKQSAVRGSAYLGTFIAELVSLVGPEVALNMVVCV
ncbi:MAG: Arginyl-tRNA--protein transferase 1 [Lichina confinis]|nr:MAG: Arginyl-tRNA--protein transferase 1 [Lichina confinis]